MPTLADLLNMGKQYVRDARPGGLLSPEISPGMPTEVAKGLLGFTPGIGDAISGYDTEQDARKGDYIGALLNGAGVLPAVPSMGIFAHMGHAKKGGEHGVNGEWYEGGKFLPTTDAAKKAPSKFPKGGKVELAPWTYGERPADDLQPLWNTFRDGIGAGTVRAPKGTPLEFIQAEKREVPDQFLRYNFPDGSGAAEYVAKRHSAVDAWNSGARYVGADGKYYKADGTPI